MRTSCSLAAAFVVSAILMAPDVAGAAGARGALDKLGDEPADASEQSEKKHVKKKTTNDKSSSIEDFVAGYEAAYALIYDRGDYEAGITALRALDHDDNPDVATLPGYVSRKPSGVLSQITEPR
jgi:hypothetical protein